MILECIRKRGKVMNKRSVLTVLLSVSLVLSSVAATLMGMPHDVQAAAQGDGKMALGANLSAQEINTMKTIFRGQNITSQNTLMVDDALLNKIFNDGTDNDSGVYSSAMIIPMQQGFGVQVQVMTPSLITQVSSETYRNTAITAGAKDVLIRVATPSAVTGEGALGGIMALLQNTGVNITPKIAQVAQKEVKVINNIRKVYHVNQQQVNVIFAEIKLNLIQNNINIQDNSTVNQIIIDSFKKYGIDANDADLQKQIHAFLTEYADTDAAKSQDTVAQLNQSIMSQSWEVELSAVNEVFQHDALIKLERPDYRDSATYREAIAMLATKVYGLVDAKSSVEVLTAAYGESFLIENMLGTVSTQERSALNALRTMLYHAVASQQVGTKDIWLDYLSRYNALNQDVNLLAIVNDIGKASGSPMQAYTYSEPREIGEYIVITTPKGDFGYNKQSKLVEKFENDQPTGAVEKPHISDEFKLEDNSIEGLDVERDFEVDDTVKNTLNGTADVAGEFDYRIEPIVVGDKQIVVNYDTQDIYKLLVGDQETIEYFADGSTQHTINVDAKYLTEGTEVKLFVKQGGNMRLVATTVVGKAETIQPKSSQNVDTTSIAQTSEQNSDTKQLTEDTTASDTTLAQETQMSDTTQVQETTQTPPEMVLEPMTSGQPNIIVTGTPNVTFQVIQNGSEPLNYTMDASGRMEIPLLVMEGDDIILNIDNQGQWLKVAQQIVAPAAEQVSAQDTTQASQPTEQESVNADVEELVVEESIAESNIENTSNAETVAVPEATYDNLDVVDIQDSPQSLPTNVTGATAEEAYNKIIAYYKEHHVTYADSSFVYTADEFKAKIYDMNQDGISELLIAANGHHSQALGQHMSSVYTFDGVQAIRLVPNNDDFTITKAGYLMGMTGSTPSDPDYRRILWKIENTQLVVHELYAAAGDPVQPQQMPLLLVGELSGEEISREDFSAEYKWGILPDDNWVQY